MTRRRIRAVGLVGIGAAALAMIGFGCGPTTPAPTQAAIESIPLRELGEAYRSYVLAKKAAPKKMTDLREYEAGYPMAMRGLQDGDLQVYWGGELLNPDVVEPGSTPSDKVLAFETRVPKEGGYVMLANREIKKMTPEEFQSAPKAADVASGDGKAKAAR